ncbi:MAG: Lipoprotein-releasing system transmembrane protein LolE [Elusimicrobia bacterium]|nr:Lipoprotein-releasing system transmembrane protein LolE [Elusimicrobiota bacterium]
MSAELYLACRYLSNRRHGAWGWMIGWLATGSVALGVAALIITLSVMTGFREDIRQKILGIQPHIIVTSMSGQLNLTDHSFDRTLTAVSGIEAWSPFVSGQVLMGHGSQSSGAMIKGIEPKNETRVANLQNKLIRGDWEHLSNDKSFPAERPAIFLGQELAKNLGTNLGDTLWVITPGSIGVGTLSVPQAHLYIVKGLVQSGLYDYDSSLAYLDIPNAQKLFDMGTQVSGVGIRIKDIDEADHMARTLQQKLKGGLWVRSWLSLNRNLFSALKLEKTVMFIILTLITLVASVMIVSNLLLSITQKIKEIGILRAMGATKNTIHRIFLIQGILMGAMGTFIGATLGIGISILLAKTNFIRLPADVYYIDRLPIRLDGWDIATVIGAACLIVLVATLIPARRAAELDPLEAIRYG